MISSEVHAASDSRQKLWIDDLLDLVRDATTTQFGKESAVSSQTERYLYSLGLEFALAAELVLNGKKIVAWSRLRLMLARIAKDVSKNVECVEHDRLKVAQALEKL